MTTATPKPRAGEHTKGPWRVGKLVSGHEDQFDICAAPGIAVAMIPGGNGNDYANARRIVACVNFCDGVSTEEIEAAPAGLELRQLLDAMDKDPNEDTLIAKHGR